MLAEAKNINYINDHEDVEKNESKCWLVGDPAAGRVKYSVNKTVQPYF